MARARNNDSNDFFDDDLDTGQGQNEIIDFQGYLRILRKNKWAITLFTGVVTALAAYYAYTATPVYRSSSTLLIESQKANVLSIEELYGIDSENSDYYGTQHEILKSRALAKRVVRRLNLVEDGLPTENPRGVGKGTSLPGFLSIDSLNGVLSSVLSFVGINSNAAAEQTDNAEAEVAFVAQESGLLAVQDGSDSVTLETGFDDSQSGEETAFDDTLRQFQSNLSITPLRKTKLVRISFESPDPVFAAEVANTVADEYIVSVLDGRMRLKEKASTWMNERVAVLKGKLDESEQKLIAFKQENGLIDVDGSVGRLNEQELLLTTAELAEAKSEFSDARDLFREIQSMKTAAPELLETIPAIQDDVLVRSVKIELGQAQRELDELANRYGSKHPRIIDARSKIESLRSTLDGHITRVVASIEKDFQLRRQRVAAIEATLQRGKEDIQVIGEKKLKLDALEREVDTNREIYNQFYSRITETDSSDGLDEANARISDYADPSAVPVKPRKQVIIALAALGSLLLSMLMAILYEQLDETIKGTEDVEGRLGTRLLGILPLINKGVFGRGKDLPLNPSEIDDKTGTFVEAVNTVRTALSIDNGQPNKVILVTSSVPGEGKSTSSLNIAYSFSHLERVLLIDCDMRRPTLAKAIGLDRNAAGLSDLIMRTAHARECIRRHAIGSLDIMTSGPTPQQPLELLSSNRFVKILNGLKNHYDRIIIDSAPTQAVSDALVLSRLSDSVVYAVKSHDTSYNLVRRGLARLKQIDAPLAGVLMTQVDVAKISAYGGDYYYQGYYDYYGYSEKDGAGSGNKVALSAAEMHRIKLDDQEVDLQMTERQTQGYAPQGNNAQAGTTRDNNQWYDDELDFTLRTDQGPEQRGRRDLRSSPVIMDDLDLV